MSNPLFDALLAPQRESERNFLLLEDGSVWRHLEFGDRAARMARVLDDAGVEPGDRVAAQIAKSPDALALYAACVQIGAVFLPLNTGYTARELDYFLGDARPRVMVCDLERAGELASVAAEYNARLYTLDERGGGELGLTASAAEPLREVVPRQGDDLAAILYTSGTTGRSKGAMLTQRNLLSNAETLLDLWRFTADDVLLHALPIFHTHGLFVASNICLLAGSGMIFLPGFNADRAVHWLADASCMMGVPTFYTRLLDHPGFTREKVKHIRLFTSGSAPLLAETHRQFEERTGHRILERYGMTETNMNTSNPYDGERRPGTVGKPLPGVELRVCVPGSDNLVPDGEVGVIEVRGDNVFSGYWQNPEKTSEELRGDGFFITGDLGRVDENGYVHIVGRGKDLIISGGYNIYPKEIEQLLDRQPGVLESAVVGAPHPDFGEGVVAVLVAEQNARLDCDAIAEQIRDDVARFKQPKHYAVVASLPRNTMGKVQKNVLREQFAEVFSTR